MKYKEALSESMKKLATDERVRFLGYNIKYGSKAYGTLKDIPNDKLIETPLAENLMTGLATGLSIEGFRPVLFFERHDFLLNALDCIVNHIDKIDSMSLGGYTTPVIIRAVVGGKKPIDPGIQHTQDYTEALKSMVSFPVIDLKSKEHILPSYENVLNTENPIMFIERRELFDY